MVNYGEDIAYWYLRLNGFFPLTNFVLHPATGGERTSDVDLLAIRPPHPFELVGGQPDDWDRWLFDQLGFGGLIGLIVEVKTGQHRALDLFRPQYVSKAVGRLGLLPLEEVARISRELAAAPLVRCG